MRICKVENCDREIRTREYCKKHYLQLWRYGKILKRTIKDKNEIIDCGDYYEIILYNYKHKEKARTKIDKNDLSKVEKFHWHTLNNKYAHSEKIKKSLHCIILEKKDGYEIDHINHDGFDNRKKNLRYVTRSQNNMNKKGVKGYFQDSKTKKYITYININYKQIYLGRFTNKQDAINARKKAEKKYFKQYAYKQQNYK